MLRKYEQPMSGQSSAGKNGVHGLELIWGRNLHKLISRRNAFTQWSVCKMVPAQSTLKKSLWVYGEGVRG